MQEGRCWNKVFPTLSSHTPLPSTPMPSLAASPCSCEARHPVGFCRGDYVLTSQHPFFLSLTLPALYLSREMNGFFTTDAVPSSFHQCSCFAICFPLALSITVWGKGESWTRCSPRLILGVISSVTQHKTWTAPSFLARETAPAVFL